MTAWLNPDCAAGKHQPCAGDAWDEDTDTPTLCACTCHRGRDRHLVADPLQRGVPWPMARQDARPAWLQDDPDGLRIVDRD